MKKYLSKCIFALCVIAFICFCFTQAPIDKSIGTVWALLPPIIAIGLALITKEVYSSLFIGIVSGGVLFAVSQGTGFEGTFNEVINDGIIKNIADTSHVGILVFLVVLGIIVVMMNKAGGSRAYGEWASKHIKSRAGASLSTFFLGVLIFVDDYFNCLTVGSVMRPVTDSHKISRAKLAYIIDATAAPVCIIAPISSWAAAVSGTLNDAGIETNISSIELFIKTIPFNLYAILTLIMVIIISKGTFDYGPMKRHEFNAAKGDLFTTKNTVYPPDEEPVTTKGRVYDLIIPVIILIAMCILGMLYTGKLFTEPGTDIITAFSNADACYGLALGSVGALILNVIYFLCRRVLKFTECMDAIPAGFKQMVPAILILVFAWTLNSITSDLEAGAYVESLLKGNATVQTFVPVLFFLVALGLSFATGTSWGTFGILIPIAIGVFTSQIEAGNIPTTVYLCMSACLAGAVCGDHCSPISDTTIMSSTGAQCDHVNHVSTQLPYALTVAGVCAVGYLIGGVLLNSISDYALSAAVILAISAVLLVGTLFVIKTFSKNNA